MNASVTSIGLENPKKEDSPMVVVAGGSTRKYSHVISTLPLPVLRTIDLKDSNLDIVQSNALRKLEYGPSIKIGILFTEPWWTTGQDKDGQNFDIVGGQSFTDLPIRTVVYPSYGVNSTAPSHTLIASYCWTNDAERMGALIGTGKKSYDEQLEHLVLSNLAAVHNTDYKYLKDRLIDVYSWDWSHNPLTMGERLSVCHILGITYSVIHFLQGHLRFSDLETSKTYTQALTAPRPMENSTSPEKLSASAMRKL